MADVKSRKTQFVEGEGLKIPVFDMSVGDRGGYLSEPETKRNTILELLFEPEELESLVIVKPDKNDDRRDPLKGIDFGDGIPRRVAFSSGNSIYFADRQLSKQLNEPFKTQPDTACRYGSLLVSSCNEGAIAFHSSSDSQPLRVKIVDWESNDPAEREEARKFSTGDCHGKISPRLAKAMGGRGNRPFQFRFAWMQKWQNSAYPHTPPVSFLAKGTFLPDRALTEDLGYDLILDKSSIKGLTKEERDRHIPCGDWELPEAVIGNRGNAKVQAYENSWQFSIWYSEAALQADIVPPTITEAQKLAEIQKDPLKLARYLVEQYDKKAHLVGEQNAIEGEESERQEHAESATISLLRSDLYGQLLDFPKVADFMRSQLAKRWQDLALKGAIHHGSAMAQPCDDLKPGTIVAPHLQDGEEAIVTRYPIVSKDNIRRYTVDNRQRPDLLRYRGCAFIRPDQAMQHHQCDFDGDQLVITPVSRVPRIAAETRHANEGREFAPVEKRSKVDYRKARDRKGQRKYATLRQIAVAVPKNSIGYIATLIGRVQSSIPQSKEPQKLFERRQRKLLGKLFDALQIEVDSPKSATRFDECHPTLIQEAKRWTEAHPSPLFDLKKDSRLYKTLPLPTNEQNPILAIAREAVNPAWERTRIRSRHRHEFRYLFPPPARKSDRKQWERDYLPWAKDLKERANQRGREIHQLHEGDRNAIKEEYGKLYEDLRGEIAETFPNAKERHLAATALWHVETTNPNLNVPRKACALVSRQLNPTFEFVEEFQRQREALPRDTYVLSIPFEKAKGKDFAGEFKAALDRKGIQYEATLHPTLPMVQFALLDPSDRLIEKLEAQFGSNDNLHIRESDLTYYNSHLQKTSRIGDRIVPPTSYTWLENPEDLIPKSALVLHLFEEEIARQVQVYRFETVELIGQKYNDFRDTNFGNRRWENKTLPFEVKPYHNPDDYRHGCPIVTLEGKQLAMFSAESPKLPIGATFKGAIALSQRGSALTLHIDPESVRLPLVEGSKLPLNLGIGKQPTEELSQKLHAAIAREYEADNRSKIKIHGWTAFVDRRTRECFVRDGDRNIVFRSNLATCEISKPLSAEDSRAFAETLGSQRRQPKSLQRMASVGSRCNIQV